MARRSILLMAALFIAALGTAMIVMYVQGIDARATEGQELVEVLTVTDTIDAGESVKDAQSAGKFETTEVVRDDMVDGALTSTNSITNDVALGAIYPGEQIISKKFGAAGSEAALTIPDDKLAISVDLTDPARVAGFVIPGSEVAIFASGDPEAIKADGSTQKLSTYTRLLVSKVQVIGVGTTTITSKTTKTKEGETTEEIPRTILTLAVDQEQAEKLIFADRNGDLAFALLSEKSKVKDGPGVVVRDIMPEVFAGIGQ
ncbi:Flp pilus assembly protein CpaB [Nocardioides sp. Soil796]|uniref:Flp pilus assembly protein CpaB n=1 Tax=Nocardioides sp. Soil796 TaxID=1736412 RepID=UPI0009E833FB|nr:Flp pilus assembly protein CpaB [Nocardioides sp. Soil796]